MADHEAHDHDHEEDEDVMQRFWGAVVEPSKGDGEGYSISLNATEVLLDLSFFPDDESVTLIVEGNAAVHVTGSVAIYGDIPDDDDDADDDAAAAPEAAPAVPSDSAAQPKAASKRQRAAAAAVAASSDDAEAPEGKPAVIPVELPAKPMTAAEKLKRQKAEAAPAVPDVKAGTKRGADEDVPPPPAVKHARAEVEVESATLKPLVGGKVQYRDDVVGTGKTPTKGHKVVVSYVGMLPSGKVFDKSSKFDFRIGTGSVIQGWDVGVASMRVGGKRRLVIHPSFAYGADGAPPDIPPHATLLFDVTLLSVH